MYIATDYGHTAIYGIGDTEDDAILDAANSCGAEEPTDGWNILPASLPLIRYVERHGGAFVVWHLVNGMAQLGDMRAAD